MKRTLLLSVVALSLSACSLAGDITPPPGLATAQAQGLGFPPTAAPLTPPSSAPDLAAGAVIYAEKCAPCHGEAGDGQGPQASALPNPPAVLRDPQVARPAVPADWYRIVTEGRIESFMPGFSSLDDGQRWDVVGYALSLGLPPAQIETGRALYPENCAGCHGERGEGQANAPDLTSPAFLAGRSLQAIYTAITDGVGEAMPGSAAKWSDEQRWALAAYVRSLALSQPPPATATAAAATPEGPTSTIPVAATTEGATSTASEGASTAPTQTAIAEVVTGLGRIRGSVVNGTAGADAPSGLEVTLHGFDGDQEGLTLSQPARPGGTFVFEGIEPTAERAYVLTAEYQDVLYASDVAQWPADATELELPLTVFETTPETDAVQVSRLHLLFDFPAKDVVQVVELWLLSNLGDRTVYAGETGAIEVGLPPGASGLSFDGGAVGDRFELTENGFRDRRQVPPGENTSELIFSYNLPYDGSLDLARLPAYPVAATVAMVSGDGPQIIGDGFVDMGQRQVSGATLHAYQHGASPAGQAISLTLRGRPSTADAGAAAVPSTVIGAAVLALALAGAALIWFRPGAARRARPAADVPVEAGADRDRILWAIASLDNEFAAGSIDAATYRERRADLLRRAQAAERD